MENVQSSSAFIVEFEQVQFSWEALFALIPEQIHVSHFGKFKIQVHEHGFYWYKVLFKTTSTNNIDEIRTFAYC